MRTRSILLLVIALLAGGLTAVPGSSAAIACSRFGAGRLYPTGSWAASVAAGHFTKDRRLDLAVATEQFSDGSNDHKVFIFRQVSGGGFRQHRKLRTGIRDPSPYRQLGTGDFNRDGRMDLALSTLPGVLLMYQRRDSTFRRELIKTRSMVLDLIVADMDSNGRPDIVIKSNGIRALLNKRRGWARLKIDDRTPRLLAVGNVVGRRRLDVAVVHERQRRGRWVVAYAQRRNGTFRKLRGIKTGLYGVGLDAKDVTGDSRADVMMVQEGVLAVYAGRKDRNGVKSRPTYYGTQEGSGPVFGARMNGDKRRDVITIHGGWNEVGVLCQKANGTLGEEVTSEVSTPTHLLQRGMVVRDLNRDGRRDVAYASANRGLGVAFQRRR